LNWIDVFTRSLMQTRSRPNSRLMTLAFSLDKVFRARFHPSRRRLLLHRSFGWMGDPVFTLAPIAFQRRFLC